jgi:unsaturated rhamnogalacturonyl hydrolase
MPDRMKQMILCSLFLWLQIVMLNAQQLPPKGETLNKMILANDYFMVKWSDVGKTIITERERPSNIWTRGVYYEGLMALHQIFPKKEYYEYAVAWGEFHGWGMHNGNTTRNADDQCCGQTYLDLYAIDPKPERIRASMIRVISGGKKLPALPFSYTAWPGELTMEYYLRRITCR